MAVFSQLPEQVDLKLVLTLAVGFVGFLLVLYKLCGKREGKRLEKSNGVKADASPTTGPSDSKTEPGTFTKASLLKFRGEDGAKSYIAVKKIVFDVSTNEMHAPGGSYHIFTGYDASRALAKMSLKQEDVENDNLADLSLSERDTLDEWYAKFDLKYERVGKMAK